MHRINRLILLAAGALLMGCPPPTPTSTVPSSPQTGTGDTASTPPVPDGPATAAAPAKAPPALARKVTEVEGISEYQLENGLRVLLFPDDSQAKVTVNITYFVGSRHEGYGEAGMAHLLEHLMFKGTPSHSDIWELLERHGARFNGTTWTDRTNYYETLPASDENLEFALALEADRMLHSNIAAEDLAKEFSVVRNEFEMGENDPRAILDERMHSAAFLWHNYGKSTIGNKSDIERVPIDNLRAFYRRFYQPDNALLVVAGRFAPEQTLELIHKYYAAIPRPTRKLQPTYTVEPVQDGERSVTLRRAGKVGVVGVLYHGVPGSHPDYPAASALTHILTSEPSGRLYQGLVKTGMATSVWGESFPWTEPGTMVFFAEVAAKTNDEKVLDRMVQIIEGLATAKGKNALADVEVARFRNREAKEFELAMADSQRTAIELTESAALGDWRLLFIHRDRVAALTTKRVVEVAGKYFKRSNRTTGRFIPSKSLDRAPLPEQPDVVAISKGYRGKGAMAKGEKFVATVANVEARTKRLTLKNGMKVALLSKETRGDAVQLMLMIRYGSERDLTGKTTAASLIPHMLMRGSKNHDYQKLKDEFDRLKAKVSFGGGSIFGGGPGATLAQVSTTRANLPEVVKLVAEVMQKPTFPKDQFEIVRKERLAALERAQNDPMSLAFNRLMRQLNPWPKQNIRYVPTTAEKIARLKKARLADVKAIHQRYWGAANAQVTVVGDFDSAAVEKALAEHFGTWTSKRPFKRVASPYKKSAPGNELIKTPDKKNAFVAVAHTVDLRDDDPDYAAAEMAVYIAAGGGASRLMGRLRQKEGLSYGAFGAIIAGALDRDALFFAGAICAPQNADTAMKYMLEEIRLLVDKGVSDDELAKAKQAWALQFKNQMAQDRFLASELNSGLFVGRTLEYQRKLGDRIQKLTAAEVHAALKKYIKPDRLFQIRAGDIAK